MYNPALVFLVNDLGEIVALRASDGTFLWNYLGTFTACLRWHCFY
jgi:outer membrane protein assembly factor BamB